MTEKTEKILRCIARVVTIGALFVAVTFCTRSLFSSNNWKIGVDVEYQYEDEPDVTHTIHYDDGFNCNTSVKWIEPFYSTPAGYTNRLVLLCSVKTNQNAKPGYVGSVELMNVPDRKFKVTNISVSTGEMTTYRPFLKKLP